MIHRAEWAEDDRYAITRWACNDDVVAIRGRRRILAKEFQRDVAAFAAQLPSRGYVLNGCADRYRFMVSFAAALQLGQISLMPASVAPGVLKALAIDYPGLYAITDGAQLPLPGLVFPRDLGGVEGLPAAAVPAEQPALILFTSGSTGRPKPVGKSWGALVRSAQAAGRRLGIARFAKASVIGTVPHQHSYGLESVILLGLLHGLVIDAVPPLYPADIRAAIERAPRPRILVTTPIHLRALVAEPANMPPVDLILSATAPLPRALAEQAERCFTAPLIEIYGCTEAGQVATRRTVHESHWHCLNGVELSQDSSGTWASGAAVEGSALLHDTIERTGTATFELGDRSADHVDVAGKRTSLAHLNHHLLSIAGVTDGTFVMEQTDGPRVARLMALVVAPELPSQAILQALRERIDASFLPRPLVMVEKLPRDALGKLPREALLRLAGTGQGA